MLKELKSSSFPIDGLVPPEVFRELEMHIWGPRLTSRELSIIARIEPLDIRMVDEDFYIYDNLGFVCKTSKIEAVITLIYANANGKTPRAIADYILDGLTEHPVTPGIQLTKDERLLAATLGAQRTADLIAFESPPNIEESFTATIVHTPGAPPTLAMTPEASARARQLAADMIARRSANGGMPVEHNGSQEVPAEPKEIYEAENFTAVPASAPDSAP